MFQNPGHLWLQVKTFFRNFLKVCLSLFKSVAFPKFLSDGRWAHTRCRSQYPSQTGGLRLPTTGADVTWAGQESSRGCCSSWWQVRLKKHLPASISASVGRAKAPYHEACSTRSSQSLAERSLLIVYLLYKGTNDTHARAQTGEPMLWRVPLQSVSAERLASLILCKYWLLLQKMFWICSTRINFSKMCIRLWSTGLSGYRWYSPYSFIILFKLSKLFDPSFCVAFTVTSVDCQIVLNQSRGSPWTNGYHLESDACYEETKVSTIFESPRKHANFSNNCHGTCIFPKIVHWVWTNFLKVQTFDAVTIPFTALHCKFYGLFSA